MTVVVLTVDQRGSRTTPDLVADAVAGLADLPLRLPFERTAGDEFQGVLDDPAALPRAVERLLRDGAWNIGLGIGAVDEPLPDHARAGRGPAYLHARTAVTAAKNSPWHLRVAGDDDAARDLESVLWLWAAVLDRRTAQGLGGHRPGRPRACPTTRPASGSASASRRSASAPRPPAWSRDDAPARSSPTSPPACSGRMADHGELSLPVIVLALIARWSPRPRAGSSRSRWARMTLAALTLVRPGNARRRSPRRALEPIDAGRDAVTAVLALTGLLAVVGGGPVTTAVFKLVDGSHAAEASSVRSAGEVLRGGAWIGALERAAVFASAGRRLARGSGDRARPQGPRPLPRAAATRQHTGTAERFIIGTFTSVLWAVACAAFIHLLL